LSIAVSDAHDPHGSSVIRIVRTAELLTRDGLKAYDGRGLPGQNTDFVGYAWVDGTHLQPSKDDQHGNVCGRRKNSTSPTYVVRSRFCWGDRRGQRMRAATIYSSRMAIIDTVRTPWQASEPPAIWRVF